MKPFLCISEAMSWCICNVRWVAGGATACVLIGRQHTDRWRYTHQGGFYTLGEEPRNDKA